MASHSYEIALTLLVEVSRVIVAMIDVCVVKLGEQEHVMNEVCVVCCGLCVVGCMLWAVQACQPPIMTMGEILLKNGRGDFQRGRFLN